MEQALPSAMTNTLSQAQLIYWDKNFTGFLQSEILSALVFSLGVLVRYTPEVVKQEGRQLLSQ